MVELSLVLPVHNQASSIDKVVADVVDILKAAHIKYEIIFVENGSYDSTLRVLKDLARKNKRLKVIQSPLGYGSAVLSGLKIAKGVYVSYMASDGQADATILPTLLRVIKKDQYELVKIKRINRESWVRYCNSKVFNFITRLLFHTNLVDINGSPRVFKKEYLKKLQLEYTDSFIDVEMAVKARALRWKILELPARDLTRRSGKSTVSLKTVLEFLKNFYYFKKNHTLEQWRTHI